MHFRQTNTEPSIHFRKANTDPSMHFREANTEFLFLFLLPTLLTLEFYQELTVLLSIPNKWSYQLTVFFNSAHFSVCLLLSESQYFVCLFIIILMLWQSCTESKKKLVRRSQQATGSIRKLQEVSGAPGSLTKHQEGTTSKNNKQTNKIQWLWSQN